MTGYDYHSALSPEVDAPALNVWAGPYGRAITHDLAAMPVLPPQFAACDVFYAEPPFRHGWDIFHRRVGRQPAMPYGKFIRLCSSLIRARGGVLIIGKHALPYAQLADYQHEIRLHQRGWTALALWYGLWPDKPLAKGYPPPPPPLGVADEPWHLPRDAREVLTWLAERFDTVGDFCAGYGYTGRVFQVHGKQWVLSDVNPRCIGYIAEHAPTWPTP